MPYDMPTASVENPSAMPRSVIRILMPAAAVTQVQEKKARLLRDDSPQDDSAVPATEQ